MKNIHGVKRVHCLFAVNTEMQEQWVKPTEENMFEIQNYGSTTTKSVESPITSISYTVAALQTATNSFSQENIIGEGSLGRVYKAEFPRGKVYLFIYLFIWCSRCFSSFFLCL